MKTKIKEISGITRVKRLENLLRVMLEVSKKPPLAFEINSWFSRWKSFDDMASAFSQLEKKDLPSCATQACTAGWCGLDPWFMKNGLETSKKGFIKINGSRAGILAMYGNANLERYFGLSEAETEQLFLNGPDIRNNVEDVTAKDIVSYARKLIRKYKTKSGLKIKN
jgi:hypothetical protein